MNELNEFEKAAQQKPPSLPSQFVLFLMENKKWWLLPIVIVIGLVGLLAVFGGSGAAPFIYTMF
jgi:hypothetical protein